eukprot:NODE_20523_length_794_cov_2.352324.p1 GENE.NODE_20523_length_794_cov_2.352324~~NODE_20523_length_794_cov_2.352324.p1  ORF type:complete len:213 (-),score=59.53 NODE_20523_length_794_cov_2.352324:77-715(-)
MRDNDGGRKGKELDERGLPVKGPHANVNPFMRYSLLQLLEIVAGYLVAWGIYSINPLAFDLRLNLLRNYDLGYLYIAVAIVTRIPDVMQIFVAVQRLAACVPNPDQYIFKTMLRDEPYIRLEAEGDVGRFNKAQRAIDNMRETFPSFLANFLMAGFVFPVPALCIAVVMLLGLVLFIVGYIKDSRVPGKVVTRICNLLAAGLVLYAGVEAFM